MALGNDNLLALSLATVVFVAGHFLVSSTPLRGALVRAIGERAYMGLYSLGAGAAIVWMVLAYNAAPREALWEQTRALRFVPLWITPLSMVLLVAGNSGSNPTAVGQGGGLKRSEEAQGINRITRHPGLVAIFLWAVAHIVALGDGAALIFFGGLAVLSAFGTLAIDRKRSQTLGADWEAFAARTSIVPFAAILGGRNRFHFAEIGWWRILGGLALYVALVSIHPWLIGVRAY